MTELQKLTKKLSKIEKAYEIANKDAVIVRARLLKKAVSVEKKIRKLTGK